MFNELRQMAIFAKTIDHGSFRGAAKAMKLSPSVVSHQISELEKVLGTALIYRSTRNLALTAEGERLLESTRAMLDAAENGFQAISEQTLNPSGELRITMPAVLSHSRLVQQLSGFLLKYPNVRLAIDFSDTRKNLIGDRFDVAIRMGWLKDSALIARKLDDTNRRLVAAKSYFKSHPKPKDPKDLNNLDWIELSAVQGKKETFQKLKQKSIVVKPSSRIIVNDAHALYQFVRAGAGLALVPEFLAYNDIKNNLVEFVLPDWQVESLGIFAVWPQNAAKNSLTKILVEYLAN